MYGGPMAKPVGYT